MSALAGLTVALLERPGSYGRPGSLATELVPELEAAGARVLLVHAEEGLHRLDEPPPWGLTLVKSGSPAALHLAAAAEAWGVPSLNDVEATRLAQDKLAACAILQRAGLPIAPSRFGWLGGARPAPLGDVARRALVVKAQRGSQGAGTWPAEPGGVAALLDTLAPGPYLVMDRVAHAGEDLKVFVAGPWGTAIRRVFPARTLAEKRGRAALLPDEVAETARAAGRLLGLRCFGCDFVAGPEGWTLVDVNAFPGYKGAVGAARAVVAEAARLVEEHR